MKLLIKLFKKTDTATISKLYIDNKEFCYTLEPNKYLIVAGTYKIKYNKSGSMNTDYKKIAKDNNYIHYGMLEVTGVPGRSSLYIHIGNEADDSKGCILVGDSVSDDRITNSTKTYILVYKKVALALGARENVEIQITR